MIGRHRITQVQENAGIGDCLSCRQILRHCLKERRTLDICRVGIPRVHLPFGSLEADPVFVTLGNLGVDLLEHAGDHVFLLHILDFLPTGPDVAQEDGLIVRTVSERFRLEINVNSTYNGKNIY